MRSATMVEAEIKATLPVDVELSDETVGRDMVD